MFMLNFYSHWETWTIYHGAGVNDRKKSAVFLENDN